MTVGEMKALLGPERSAACVAVAERWQRWIDDPDHNAPPTPKASATRLREWKARQQHLHTLVSERKQDPEPSARYDPEGHLSWTMREIARQATALSYNILHEYEHTSS
jgi:hypothetical protein